MLVIWDAIAAIMTSLECVYALALDGDPLYVIFHSLLVISCHFCWPNEAIQNNKIDLESLRVLLSMDRVRNIDDCHIVKQVNNELSRLHELGFTTWYSRVWKLVHQYNIDLFNNDGDLKTYCKSVIENKFRENWEIDVQNKDKKSHPPYLCKD